MGNKVLHNCWKWMLNECCFSGFIVMSLASANWRYGELRKQNDATTLLGSILPPYALRGILFIVLLRAPAIPEDYDDRDVKLMHYGHSKCDEQKSVDALLRSYFPCISAHLFSRHCKSLIIVLV